MKFKSLFPIILLLALLLGCAPSTSEPESETTPVTQPQETSASEPSPVSMPDFTVYDIDGNEVHLSDFRGKPVVLNFWASWCGPCKMEMPDFNEKYLELGEDVHFLMINLTDGSDETLTSASGFIAQQGYTFPVYYDTTLEAAMLYGIRSIPTTFFIDADGYGVTQFVGTLSATELQSYLDKLLPQE